MKHAALGSCLAVIATVLSLLVAPATSQEPDEAFKGGLRARREALENAGKWSEVVSNMRLAIAVDPKESIREVAFARRLVLATANEPYLPHFFLGEAFYSQGLCAPALDAWSISERQGVIGRTKPEYRRTLETGKRLCEAKGILPSPQYDELVSSTRRAVTQVAELSARVSDAGRSHPALWTRSRQDAFERAGKDVQASREALTTAERGRASKAFTEATAAAGKASADLTPLEAAMKEDISVVDSTAQEAMATVARAQAVDQEINAAAAALTKNLHESRQQGLLLLAQVQQFLTRVPEEGTRESAARMAAAARSAYQMLNQVLAEGREQFGVQLSQARVKARNALGRAESSLKMLDSQLRGQATQESREAAATGSQLQREIVGLRSQLGAADANGDLSSMIHVTGALSGVASRLDKLLGVSPMRLRGVPLALEDGVRQFLRGDLRQATEALRLAPMGVGPWSTHLHLFKAAALFETYLLAAIGGGQSAESVPAEVITEIQRCKALDPAFRPDPRAFSPRFIRLFQGVDRLASR